MPVAARMPYRDPDSTTPTWVVIFVLASLLVHMLLVVSIILMSIHLPAEKFAVPPPQNPEVSLSLQPPPPTAPPPPPRQFMPTEPQQNVVPKNTPIESDNDTNLTSKSHTSRQPDAVMPDVTSQHKHPDSLVETPNSPSTQKPKPANPAPTPKQEQQQKSQPTPPQPKPEQTQPQPKPEQTPPQQTPPTPNPSTAQKPPPTPPTTPPPKPVQYDPNGLPELPAISAPTIAPQTPATSVQAGVPPPLMPQVAADVQGRAGLSGAPTPEAMATELGKYKAKVYRAVGTRWYGKVNDQLQVLPVGSVRIQYTIYSDGRVETKVLDGGNGTMELLLSVSRNSITEAAPFDQFSPAMLKEVGESYTDDFTFSIYSGN